MMDHFAVPINWNSPVLWLAKFAALAGYLPLLALFVFAAAETSLIQLVSDHQIGVTWFGGFTLSAAVGALRNPWDGWYNTFFRFANTMMANIPQQLAPQHFEPQMAERGRAMAAGA